MSVPDARQNFSRVLSLPRLPAAARAVDLPHAVANTFDAAGVRRVCDVLSAYRSPARRKTALVYALGRRRPVGQDRSLERGVVQAGLSSPQDT